MTAEAIPQPGSDEPMRPAEGASAQGPAPAEEPNAPGNSGQATSEAATATAESTAPADESTAAASASEATAESTAAVAADPAAPAVAAGPSRRAVALSAMRRMVVFVLAVGLFTAGAAGGLTVFQRTHPPAQPLGDPVAGSAEPPPVAREFIAALANNDADALRSSLERQPHKDLTDELDRYGIERVTGVTTLGTVEDGGRSATMVMLNAEQTGGVPFAINLVILVDGGKIEGFR